MTVHLCSVGRHHNDGIVAHHCHEEHELIVVLAGRCRIASDDRDHHLGPGDCLLIPAGSAHDQRNRGRCHNHYLKFTTTGTLPALLRLHHDDDLIPRWCQDLEHLQTADDPSTCDALFAVLLAHLQRHTRDRQRTAALPPAVHRACTWIEEHYHEAVSCGDVARAVDLSPSHCGLLFRRHCHCSPGAYLLAVRMRHARRLLRDDYRSIGAVAALVGLPDANHFARRFRQAHGCPPGAWRRQELGGASWTDAPS